MAITNKIRLNRLEILHDMLVNHDKYFPCILFKISIWEKFLDGPGSLKKGHLCKSAACALGSAALYHPFNKMGLRMREKESDNSQIPGGHPVYGKYESFEAGEFFFGITNQESFFLFDPEEYEKYQEEKDNVTPKMVARRVKKLIKQYGGKANG